MRPSTTVIKGGSASNPWPANEGTPNGRSRLLLLDDLPGPDDALVGVGPGQPEVARLLLDAGLLDSFPVGVDEDDLGGVLDRPDLVPVHVVVHLDADDHHHVEEVVPVAGDPDRAGIGEKALGTPEVDDRGPSVSGMLT